MFCIKCGAQMPALEHICPGCGFDMQEEETRDSGMQTLDVEPEAAARQSVEDALVEALLQAQEQKSQTPVVEELDLENILADTYGRDEGLEDLTEEEIYPSWANIPEEIYFDDSQPRKRTRWAVLGGVLAVLLLVGLGAFFGIRYYQNQLAYDRAMVCLESREYDEALSLLMGLGDFKDSAAYTKDLQQKFRIYQDALNGMKSGKFDGAAEAFAALGDFKDSRELLEKGINWYKGEYLLRCAQNRDKDGMALVAGVDETTEDYLVWVLMLMSAKEQYSGIAEYKDAADKIQVCYLEAARVLAFAGQMDAAFVYKDMLSRENQDLFMEECRTLCGDDAFLEALETALNARMKLEKEAGEDLRPGVQTEQSYLGRFQKLYFLDKNLQKIALSYLEGVYVQWMSLDKQGLCQNPADWARGQYLRLKAVKDLCEQYGFLASDAELAEYYLGGFDAARAQNQIHSSLKAQLTAVMEGDAQRPLRVTYKNDCGYAFNVTFTFTFYAGDEQVAQTTATAAMGKGQEKTVKGKQPEAAYDRWTLSWTVFDITGDGWVDMTGVYAIYSMHMLEYDSLFDREDLIDLGRGNDSLELFSDGTGIYTSNGVAQSIEYSDSAFWFADQPQNQVQLQVVGGMITFTLDQTEYTFKK